MSYLSDSLERQLRLLQEPTPAAIVTVVPERVSMKFVSPVYAMDLAYQQGTSDKVYHVQIVKVKDGTFDSSPGYGVDFQYGRRGKNLIKGTKTSYPVSLQEAINIYYNLTQEKLKKGYKVI